MCVRFRLRGVVWDGGSLAPVGGSSRQAGAGRHNQVRVVGWTGILQQDGGDVEKASRRWSF